MRIRNTFIIFVVSGFWHGANWTFIVWGALNAIYFLPLLLRNNNRNNLNVVAEGRTFPSLREFLLMLGTFGLTVLAWIFFRAENMTHAINYLSEIFSSSLFAVPSFPGIRDSLITIALVMVFVLIEWNGRRGKYAIAHLGEKWKTSYRYAAYYALAFSVMYFGNFDENQFIYFQF